MSHKEKIRLTLRVYKIEQLSEDEAIDYIQGYQFTSNMSHLNTGILIGLVVSLISVYLAI